MRNKRFLVNLSGMLLACAIAFGGAFAVWSRLRGEKERLLSGGGEAKILSEEIQSADVVSIEVKEAGLTPEELRQAVLCLESTAEKVPHEPVPGQLSMTDAIQCGMIWIEGFFLPHLDGEAAMPGECRMNCYLWAGQENPLLGYWEVSFSGEAMEAALILNAVTGQVLQARIALAFPGGGRPDEDSLSGLLEEYADSFGVETNYAVSRAEETETGGSTHGEESGKDWRFGQRLENEEMAACLEAGEAVGVSADSEDGKETLCFALYWETKASGE